MLFGAVFGARVLMASFIGVDHHDRADTDCIRSRKRRTDDDDLQQRLLVGS